MTDKGPEICFNLHLGLQNRFNLNVSVGNNAESARREASSLHGLQHHEEPSLTKILPQPKRVNQCDDSLEL